MLEQSKSERPYRCPECGDDVVAREALGNELGCVACGWTPEGCIPGEVLGLHAVECRRCKRRWYAKPKRGDEGKSWPDGGET